MDFSKAFFWALAIVIGLPLIIGGFVGFWAGIYLLLTREISIGYGILVAIGSILGATIGLWLQKVASNS